MPRLSLIKTFKSIFFAVIALFIGRFIALKISAVPTRTDFVAFVSALFFIPIVKFPAFGLFLLLVLPLFIPFIRRVFYLMQTRITNDPLLLIPDIIVGLLIFATVDMLRKGKRFISNETNILFFILVYIAYLTSRIFILNTNIGQGLQSFKLDVFFISVFFFPIFLISDFKQIIAFCRITTVLAFLLSLYGIKQFVFGYTSFEEIWLDYMRTEFVTLFIGGTARPFSTLASPATFADFMQIGMITAFALAGIKKGGGSRLYLFLVPTMAIAILLTSVRSNWIGAVSAIFLWVLIAHRSSFRVKIIVVVVVITASIPISILIDKAGSLQANEPSMNIEERGFDDKTSKSLADIFVKERVSAVTNPFEEHSMKARITMWGFVIERSLQLPQGPFGWGLGSFNAHSYYFTVLYETGYIGIILLLYILYRFFRTGYKVYIEEEQRDKRQVIRACITIIFSISILNLTGPHTGSHPADIYFWGCAGILYIIRRLPFKVSAIENVGRMKLTDPT